MPSVRKDWRHRLVETDLERPLEEISRVLPVRNLNPNGPDLRIREVGSRLAREPDEVEELQGPAVHFVRARPSPFPGLLVPAADREKGVGRAEPPDERRRNPLGLDVRRRAQDHAPVEERDLRDAVFQRTASRAGLAVESENTDLAPACASRLAGERVGRPGAGTADEALPETGDREGAPVLLDEVEGRLAPAEERVDGVFVGEDTDFRQDAEDVGLPDRAEVPAK